MATTTGLGSHAGRSPTEPQPISVGWILVVLGPAIIGAAIGGYLGWGAAPRYTAQQSIDLRDVIDFEVWEANGETGRFAQVILRPDIKQQAANTAGVPAGDLGRIGIDRLEGSSVVALEITGRSRAAAEAGLPALADAALSDILASERVAPAQVIEATSADHEAAVAKVADLTRRAELAPGTDLRATYNQAVERLAITAARIDGFDENTSEWLENQVVAENTVAARRVDRLTPLVAEWDTAATEADRLGDLLGDAEEALAAIDDGATRIDQSIVGSQLVLTEDPVQVRLRSYVASGAAVGVAVGLLVATVPLIRRSGRRP